MILAQSDKTNGIELQWDYEEEQSVFEILQQVNSWVLSDRFS